MTNEISFLIIFSITFIDLLIISLTDIRKGLIYNFTSFILFILGILSVFFANETKEQLWFPFTMFGIAFVIQFVIFAICGENTIGGGDIKVLSSSLLFIHNINEIFNYLIILGLFSLIGIIITKIKSKNNSLRYGPYMALSLIGHMTISHFKEDYFLNVIICFVFILMFINSLFYRKDVLDYANTKYF